MPSVQILQGDCRGILPTIPSNSIQCCVTSPPYWGLRDYGHPGQIGQESTPETFVEAMRAVFAEVRRVLKPDGTCWLNLGDSYTATSRSAGASLKSTLATKPTSAKTTALREQGARRINIGALKPKDLIGIPWRVALALQQDGWYLRSDIIWAKPNPMPESVTDRPTKAHEYIFLLTKSERYYYDAEAIRQPYARTWNESNGGSWSHGKGDAARVAERGAAGTHSGPYPLPDKDGANKRTVWEVPSAPYSGAHFATYPPDLIKPCILAGTKPGDTVLDPFGGSGTTGQVALELGRNAIMIELNPKYVPLIKQRTNITPGLSLPPTQKAA